MTPSGCMTSGSLLLPRSPAMDLTPGAEAALKAPPCPGHAGRHCPLRAPVLPWAVGAPGFA